MMLYESEPLGRTSLNSQIARGSVKAPAPLPSQPSRMTQRDASYKHLDPFAHEAQRAGGL